MRSCRLSSVRMPASSSTAIAIPHRRSSYAGPSAMRASRDEVRLLHEGQVVAQHVRSYERGQLLVLPEHRLAALALGGGLGAQRWNRHSTPGARGAPVPPAAEEPAGEDRRPSAALARSGQALRGGEVLAAISRALELATYDAAYVENLLLAARRRRQLPTPTLPTPKRRELIDEIELDPADPALYDRFCTDTEEDSHGTTNDNLPDTTGS